jgi:hypothetical protein
LINVIWGFTFWSDVAAAAERVNLPPEKIKELRAKAAGFFAEMYTLRTNGWCFTTRQR